MTAPGQLSPFPSCADGLGFINSVDYRSTSSLLTPAASVCTVSSLAQSGEGADSRTRTTTKTMQTKEILKSPQPHRFHLVLSSRKLTPELPSLPSRPSAQWKFKDAGLAPPGGGSTGDAEHDQQDVFSPAITPFIPTAPDLAPYSPQSPYADAAGELRPADTGRGLSGDSRPTSTSSALSVRSSFTLVQDQSSKRISSTSSTFHKETYTADFRKVTLLSENSLGLINHEPAFDLVEDESERGNNSCPVGGDGGFDKVGVGLAESSPPLSLLHEAELEELPIGIPPPFESRSSGDSVASQGNVTQITSRTLDSLLAKYQSRPNSLCDNSDNDNVDILTPPSSDTVMVPLPTANPSTSTSDIPALSSEPAPSPTKAPQPRDRRKFALRRQAIYAEYGFQIALPDSDSESSIKVLSSPSGKKGTQGRAASAYVSSSRSGSLSTSTSGGDRPTSRGNDDPDDGPTVLFGAGSDRLERFSVQDDILAATRNPLLEDLADLTTSTPPRTKSRSASQRSLLACAAVPLPLPRSRPGEGTRAPLGSQKDSDWGPLRIRKSNPIHHELLHIPMSASERKARLAAWEVEPGHHATLRGLIAEVDKAVEQWRWIMQLRTYV